jgi:hypothetical protein
MLVKPVKDLLDGFVIDAVNRLFTVATVENQHIEPWERPELGAVVPCIPPFVPHC